MAYGLPFRGSKNIIAKNLISELSSGVRFVDLFGGGGAMTHVAAESGKYDRLLYNDNRSQHIILSDLIFSCD